MKFWLGWFCLLWLVITISTVPSENSKISDLAWISNTAGLAAVTATAIWGFFY